MQGNSNLEISFSALCARAVSERITPGGVAGVSAEGEVMVRPFGRLTYEEDARDVSEDTVYDIASVTKAVVATLALQCAQEGILSLSERVTRYIPELSHDYGATLLDLLEYRVYGPRLSSLAHYDAAHILRHVYARGFARPPGEFTYTNVPALLLGIVLEKASGTTLDAFAEKKLFLPLGMNSTSFFPARFDISRIAPSEIAEDGLIRGVVHDESARSFALAGKAVGHAGLFSTVPDMLRFLSLFVSGGVHEGKRYLPRESLETIARSERGETGSIVLGWSRPPMRFFGIRASASAFGKTGFTGASILCDPEKRAGVVLLTNRTYPRRPESDEAIQRLRGSVADALLP